eukprot:11128-Heterococcus_DN1.PRE.4
MKVYERITYILIGACYAVGGVLVLPFCLSSDRASSWGLATIILTSVLLCAVNECFNVHVQGGAVQNEQQQTTQEQQTTPNSPA